MRWGEGSSCLTKPKRTIWSNQSVCWTSSQSQRSLVCSQNFDQKEENSDSHQILHSPGVLKAMSCHQTSSTWRFRISATSCIGQNGQARKQGATQVRLYVLQLDSLGVGVALKFSWPYHLTGGLLAILIWTHSFGLLGIVQKGKQHSLSNTKDLLKATIINTSNMKGTTKFWYFQARKKTVLKVKGNFIALSFSVLNKCTNFMWRQNFWNSESSHGIKRS